MLNLKNLETNLSLYRRRLEEIKSIMARQNGSLAAQFHVLRDKRAVGAQPEDLMPECYALVYRAVQSVLGLTPHDVQVLGAIAMAGGKIIELATGEGKTLVAVFAACLGALDGKGVHVLTANDYLARRDAGWMGGVYRLLGVSTGHIGELSSPEERRAAYGRDVTYLTAKEAGFDYLRGFLVHDPAELTQRPFHLAVIDEVDSILIDDARIPLVIGDGRAGGTGVQGRILRAVQALEPGRHVGLEDHGSIVYLEDEGAARLEADLDIDNLYEEKNQAILEQVDAALKAVFLLRRDVDYIVRDGKVLIVDAVTGRVARKRQWTDGLQAAVEEKEGLEQTGEGRILDRITFRDLLALYPAFCGMTGTARSAADEFFHFYHRGVTVLPPNVPCVREDLPDVIFKTKADKYRAAVEEVLRVHATGQPILLGTGSVAESELVADMLRGRVADIQVLNARHDAREAGIIAEAGRPGAVTISTNMAGRGVDIPLGGTDGAQREAVRHLGGLYVLGLNRHESERIDNQLRGRAGRQGDPGKSRFFVSLEDDLYVKYGLTALIEDRHLAGEDGAPLESRTVKKLVGRMQGIVEVQTFDAKATLFKYGTLLEDQRMAIHRKRRAILLGEDRLDILERESPDRWEELSRAVSRAELDRAERQIALYALNLCWSDYLLFADSVLGEVQLVSAARQDPLAYYNAKLQEGFRYLEEQVRQTVLDLFARAVVRDGLIVPEDVTVYGPTNTNTYMVHDGTEDQDLLNGVSGIGAAAFGAPFLFLYLIARKLKGKKKSV